MRQEQLAEGPRAWHSQKLFQEQRGFSLDDLDRFGMPVPEDKRTGALWRTVPVGDLSRVLSGRPPVDPPAANAAGAAGSSGRLWPALRPVGPGPEDQRMQAEILDLARGAAQDVPCLRGSFADFRQALRSHLTGIDPRPTGGSGPDLSELAAIVGTSAARSHLRGDLALADLPYRARHRDGLGAYRFGESQLEDLGYYQRLHRPAAANDLGGQGADRERGADGKAGAGTFAADRDPALAWCGRFTGRRGITTIADLMSTAAQERLILEAFVQHLRDLSALLPQGRVLAGWLGRPIGFDGSDRMLDDSPENRLTVSALLAAAQVHGPAAVCQVLLEPDSLTGSRAVERTLRSFTGYATPFDGVPRPGDAEIEAIMQRVRSASTEGRAEPRRPATQGAQGGQGGRYLNHTINF
ncbi:hypothetical protein ACFOGJ_21225 [Marinibaculum pumilum]|uniref:Uncharacterized protein n=1 Tax=Marinibaculum pumilum TaxID=1766165 RepID=A0ABV7L600_9PROT